MNVPEPLRRRSMFGVQVDANELAKHTLEVTSNPLIFDPRYSDLIDRINDAAVSIALHVWKANDLRLDVAVEREKRRKHQKKAIKRCDELLYLITLAKRTFHLRDKKVGYWSTKAYNLMERIRRWRDSDSARCRV